MCALSAIVSAVAARWMPSLGKKYYILGFGEIFCFTVCANILKWTDGTNVKKVNGSDVQDLWMLALNNCSFGHMQLSLCPP